MVKIFVITYSTYGHINKVAESIVEGLKAVAGVEVGRYQIAETLSQEILTKMHAPPKPDLPIIQASDLPEADAYMFGFPTRYGTTPAQVKAFFDSTGQLWAKQALAGKPAGLFFSTASQHGGQEVTVMSSLPILAHHGIIYVPFGYANAHLFDNSEVIGGSAWGAGTIAGGDGSRQPSPKELEIAKAQGESFAKVATKLAA